MHKVWLVEARLMRVESDDIELALPSAVSEPTDINIAPHEITVELVPFRNELF